MTLEELAAQSDEALAMLYRGWSEEFYCAGWMGHSEREFVASMLNATPPEKKELLDYERKTLSTIRRIVAEQMEQR